MTRRCFNIDGSEIAVGLATALVAVVGMPAVAAVVIAACKATAAQMSLWCSTASSSVVVRTEVGHVGTAPERRAVPSALPAFVEGTPASMKASSVPGTSSCAQMIKHFLQSSPPFPNCPVLGQTHPQVSSTDHA